MQEVRQQAVAVMANLFTIAIQEAMGQAADVIRFRSITPILGTAHQAATVMARFTIPIRTVVTVLGSVRFLLKEGCILWRNRMPIARSMAWCSM